MKALALIALFAGGMAAAGSAPPLPFAVGGPFELTDHTGATRTEADPDGLPQLLFFGYANCQQICSAALPLMADAADDLAADGINLRLVMITVDPARDTVDDIGPPLAAIRPGFIGLTGTEEALQVAYDAFNVEKEELFYDPEYGPVFAHGSFIYLLDGAGEVLTLLPPILTPEEVARIVAAHLDATG